jgi:hypothetical protein
MIAYLNINKNMKNISFFTLIVLLATLLFSCSKDKLTVSFDLKQSAVFTFPASGPLGVVNWPILPVNTDFNGTFASNNTDKDHLKSLNVKSILLSVTNPAGKPIRFLKSIELYISADGVSEVRLAHKNPFPTDSSTSVSLDLDNVDIAQYIKKDKFNLRASFEQRDVLLTSVDLKADMVFGAVAYLLK